MSRPRYLTILSLVGSVVVVAGELLGNIVANLVSIPTTWQGDEPLVFVLVTILLVNVGWWLSRLQESTRRTSRRLRRWATVLLAVYGLLAAADGLAANLAAASLTSRLGLWAYPLFAGVTVLAVALSVYLSWVQRAPSVEATNRRRFLNQLQDRYRRQRNDALRGAALLALGLQPDAAPAQSAFVPTTALDANLWPEKAGIMQVFDAVGGHLLLLGMPGAGKTTLLAELAQHLITRTRTEGAHPMPVIFNLSTWANDRDPLDKWMVEELPRTYHVPLDQAKQWVGDQAILPLLDGLDEVDEQARNACTDAINRYHADHERVPLVVCSREAEYRDQATKLELPPVLVEPLTPQQVYTFLTDGGLKLEGLRQAVDADANLLEVLRAPLFLNLVTLTYQDLPPGALPPVGDRAAWNRQLFADYVERVLAPDHRRKQEIAPPHSLERTTSYLAWLAWQMREHGEAELYLERLQPDWLPSARSRRVFSMLAKLVAVLFFVLIFGLVLSLGVVLDVVLNAGQLIALLAGLVFSLVVALLGRPFGGQVIGQIRPRAALQWSWRQGLGDAWRFGLIAGLIFGGVVGIGAGWFGGLLVGLGVGLLMGLGIMLGAGLDSKQVSEQDYRAPNEGIHRSAQNGLGVGLLAGLVTGLVAGLAVGLGGGLIGGLSVGLGGGLGIGLLVGMAGGGDAALQHVMLRWVLLRNGLVPRHFVSFLNYAADHILLQRAGGGYRFIHPLLRDYFADLHTLLNEEHTRGMSR